MNTPELQQQLFTLIKSKIASNQSLADVIQDMLGISADSAYRRIRGEKPLSPDELKKLCLSFNISLDQFFNQEANTTLFNTYFLDNHPIDFAAYFNKILEYLKIVQQLPESKIYIDTKDIPPFYYSGFNLLTAFKFYVWMQFTGQLDSSVETNFLDIEAINKLLPKSIEINKIYCSIPSVEIWNPETVNSSIRQVEYYYQSGVIKNKETAKAILQELVQLVSHIEKQVEHGKKFLAGTEPDKSCADFNFFVNRVFLGDFTLYAESQTDSKVFIIHGILNFMITDDKRFVAYTKKSFENLMRKSSLISVINEGERNKFFKAMKEKIYKAAEAL